ARSSCSLAASSEPMPGTNLPAARHTVGCVAVGGHGAPPTKRPRNAKAGRGREVLLPPPQIDGALRVAAEGEVDRAALARGGVGGEKHLLDDPAVLAADEGLLVVPHALHEVGELLREAVVPELLVDRVGPTGGDRCFLDDVVVAFLAVGLQCNAH